MNDHPIRQAVILAGGLGTRLHPVTLHMPKPLIPVAGRPFIDHLLIMLKNQGIEEVVMLLGYRADMVMDHLGDGSVFGLRIRYSVRSVEDDTGERLKKATEYLSDEFLLMYCDNYWPMNLTRLYRNFRDSGCPAQVTVYTNTDGYTRSNLMTDADGNVRVYDKSRTCGGLNGVDIGFALLRRDVMGLIPDGNVNFEGSVYPGLALSGRLAAFRTDHRYYSIGDLKRVPLTEAFITGKPAAFLDRDGVLNERPPRKDYVKRPEEFQWKPGAVDAVQILKRKGYRVFVVTNQAGIARGIMTEGDLADVHAVMTQTLEAEGANLDGIYHCPHGWDEGCSCRKPRPGMLYQAQKDHGLDLSRSILIGDEDTDIQAGEAAGCLTFKVSDTDSLLDIVNRLSGGGNVERE
jgi:D-glycero-D-manno-heptose 1,7-bisphosphate phosphatase